jgi:4'-phosphopantetheinyl transferase
MNGCDGDLPTPAVQIGCVDTSRRSPLETERDLSLLDDDEQKTFARFVFDMDRRDYAAAHALLRRMLHQARPDVAAEDFRFLRTPGERPELALPAPRISFNLSHARGIVACAVSREAEVGIDAECDDRRMEVEPLTPEVCSAREQAQLHALPSEMRGSLFLDLWTLKEAYLKALGIGIMSGPLNLISFDLSRQGEIRTELTRERPPWHFALLRPTATSRVSLAVRSVGGPRIDARLHMPGIVAALRPVHTSYG